MRERPHRLLAVLLVVAILVPCALAARGGKKKQRKRSKQAGQTFVLESELVAQVPEIATALAWANDHPADGAAWQTLGHALAEFGDLPDAISALERGTIATPDDAELWADLGAALLRAEEFQKGLRALGRALELEPFLALAHYNVGVAQRALGHWEPAMDAFEKALLLDPALGDPTKNPGAVNNTDLGLVKLRVYMKTTGGAPALFSTATER